MNFYQYTLVPDSPWKRLSATARRNIAFTFWVISWDARALAA